MRTKTLRYHAALDEPMMIQPPTWDRSPTWDKSDKSFFQTCKWNRRKEYFNNNNPIVLELACGRWEYTVGLSQIYPDKNFIGVDQKGERMMQWIKVWRQQAESNKQQAKDWSLRLETWSQCNVAFLRTIIHHIDQFFAPGEVDEIWIVHPDPRSKGYDERRRLTSPRFLRMYYEILKPWGILRLKTDDDGLFEYSLGSFASWSTTDTSARMIKELPPLTQWTWRFELIDSTTDLYQSPLFADHYGIRTHYEEMFVGQGRTIKYAKRKKTMEIK